MGEGSCMQWICRGPELEFKPVWYLCGNSSHFESISRVPDTALNALILTTALWGSCCYYHQEQMGLREIPSLSRGLSDRRLVEAQRRSALPCTLPPHDAGQCLPVNSRALLANRSEANTWWCILPLPPAVASEPLPWAALPTYSAPSIGLGVGNNRRIRHSPCPHRTQSRRRNSLVWKECNMHCDVWPHPDGRWKRCEHTEKTDITFPLFCQGKWKANSCIVAESISFWWSAYLNTNVPLSQVHASVSIMLLTWLSLEKDTDAPTSKGNRKMWSV